jgi:tetratricopeptide (TPR) repeat protein
VVLCVAVLWPAPAWSTRQQEEAEDTAASEGEVLLERWQAEAARQWAEKRLASEPQHPTWRFLLAQALFELGRYAEALETFDALLKETPHPRLQAYREFVAQTIQSTAGRDRAFSDLSRPRQRCRAGPVRA